MISWCAGRVLQQHGELIAAPAGDGLLGGHHRPQPPRRLGEHQVARAVADQVVDRGEAVEVEEDDPGLALGRGLERLPGALLHVGAVRQPGQPVVEGEVGHLLAQRDLVGDVPDADQQPGGLAGQPVEQHGALDVPPGAVGGPHPAGEAAVAVGCGGAGSPVPLRAAMPDCGAPSAGAAISASSAGTPTTAATTARAAPMSSGWTNSLSGLPTSASGG